MAEAKQFVTLGGAVSSPHECGPFDSVTVTNTLSINESSTPCATFANGVWTITDGAQLGDSGLDDMEFPIILGQAKLVE